MSARAIAQAAPLAAQAPVPVQLPDILPADLQVSQLVLSRDTLRAYVVSPAGDIWLYNRATKTRTQLVKGEAWDLSLAGSGTAIAYTHAGVKRTDRTVWILPLNPRTGLATGPERQASGGEGDAPSLSADGQSLAFARDDASGVGQSIVIVPVAGGAERVVSRSLSPGVGYIRWTTDGKSLVVGLNPPIACDPGWSCLPLRTDQAERRGSIQRIPLDGGNATTLATVASAWPGPSPDGTLLYYADTGRKGGAIADGSGRKLQTFMLPQGETVQGWLGSSSLLVSAPRSRTLLHRVSVATGATSVMAETDESVIDAAMSPDGSLASLAFCVGTKCQLRIVGTGGATRRDVPLTDLYLTGNSWSPDQRWVAYVTRTQDQALHFNALEAATGKITHMGDLPAGGSRPTLLWLADSRRITVAQDRVVGTGQQGGERRTAFHEFGLDGQHRALREISLGSGQAGASAMNGTTALIYRASASQGNQLPTVSFTSVPLDPTGSERPFALPPSYYFPPLLSGDRAWVVLRSVRDETGVGTFEVLHPDGSGRRTVTMPFIPAFGNDNGQPVANGEQLLVRENSVRGHDTGVFVVTVATNRSTKLFSIPASERVQQFSVSADGKTITYLTAEPVAPHFLAIDLAAMTRSSRQ